MKENEYKKYLKELTETVALALTAIDIEMRKPSTHQRGSNIAKICNFLEMANDRTMHFGLGYGWKKMGNIKKAKQLTPAAKVGEEG